MDEREIKKAAQELCTTETQPDRMKDFGISNFMAGARWRINTVWHEPSAYGDELKKRVDVIVKTYKGYRFGIFNAVGFYNESFGFVSVSCIEYALSEVLEYAYLSDLLPERKEEAE